jgi:type I restriction enzyme M protein
MFYNTGIATYIWVITNRKPEHRRGRVQLIDATQWFKPLRKNLGKKNCELSEEDIRRICDTFLEFQETEQSMIFPHQAFGYWKVTVERPLRLKGTDHERACTPAEIKRLKESAERSESAPPVIRKIHKSGTVPDPLHGLFEVMIKGKPRVVEYEPETELRDTEQVPLQEEGGIEAFLRRRCCPTPLMLGMIRIASELDTRSASHGTSTSPSHCGRWRRSGRISWRWRMKPRD